MVLMKSLIGSNVINLMIGGNVTRTNRNLPVNGISTEYAVTMKSLNLMRFFMTELKNCQ